jgi:hypothetical protein
MVARIMEMVGGKVSSPLFARGVFRDDLRI